VRRIKVLLVQNDPDWGHTVTGVLQRESDLVVIGAAHAKEDAVLFARKLDIDVVIIDAMLNGNGLVGIDIALEIHALKTAKMIMLTFRDHRDLILEAFSNGVTDYIVNARAEDIPAAIRAVYHNQSSIHFIAAGVLRREYMRLKQREIRKSLTKMEYEVLGLVGSGFTRQQIARNLHITESTVKKHANQIIKKMGTCSSREAARKAKLKGIL
jgi:two-component system response regulator DevR